MIHKYAPLAPTNHLDAKLDFTATQTLHRYLKLNENENEIDFSHLICSYIFCLSEWHDQLPSCPN